MSREMLWERKETELTWMLLDGNQQTILKKQELGGSWHILLSGGDWQFLVLCTWGMNAPSCSSILHALVRELNLQPLCSSFTEHSISLICFPGKELNS